MSLAANRIPIVTATRAGMLSGAVTVVWHRGEILQVNEIGWRDVDAGLPMERDTIFRVASMTKPVTVAAALALAEEGKLALDDPVHWWVPELATMRVLKHPEAYLDATVPARREITIEDLMTHRSGLAYSFSAAGPLARGYRLLSVHQDQDRWIAELSSLPLAHQPGDQLTYGHGTDVLGVVLSRIESKPLDIVVTERILAPLGMHDTRFHISSEQRRRVATMYQLQPDGRLRPDIFGPPLLTRPTLCLGGVGLWSTADDYLRFVRMLLGGGALDGQRVLSEESVQMIRTDRLTAEQKQVPFLGAPFWHGRGFGLNVSVVTDPAKSTLMYGPGGLGAFGWPGAYGTWWQADPQADLILIYLTQNCPIAADATAISGNTLPTRLQNVLPTFVRSTYKALEL